MRKTIISLIVLGVLASAGVLYFALFYVPEHLFGQGIQQLDQWSPTTTPYSAIAPRTHAKGLYMPYSNATTSRMYATTFCINNASPSCITAWPEGGEGSGDPFAWTPEADGNSTSTRLIFGNGFISQASSTNVGALTVTGTITGNLTGAVTGNASTASALAVNGANCSSGNAPLGVNASGAVEDCFDVWTEAENTAAGYTTNTGTVTNIATTWPIIGGPLTTTGTLTFGGLSTSSPIAAAPGLLYATGVNTLASVSTSSALVMSITGNAGTASALAANGANCSSGSFPLGVDTAGAVESCTDAWTEAENTSAAYISLASLSATFPLSYNSGIGAFTWTGAATSTALADTQILYGTAANTFGSEAAFTYDDSTNLLTVGSISATEATSTTFFATTASSTNLAVGGVFRFFNQVWSSIADVASYINGLIDARVTLSFVQSLVSNDFHNLGGTDDDQPEAGDYAAASIDGDDVNSNLAGRSLTLTGASPDTLDIDNEIFNKIITVNIASSSMSTTTRVAQHKFATAFTVTRISCNTDAGAAEIDPEERAEATPNTAGDDVLSAPLRCDNDNADSTSFANAGIAADAVLNFEISDASPTGAKPTMISISVEGTYDD